MMKWLRKHSKQIMVALVLVAMFSFVGGSALVNILSPRNTNPVLLKAFGHNVTNNDLHAAQRDIQLFDTIGIPWRFGNNNAESYHWYMLVHEAEDAGIVVTDAEVDKVVEGLKNRLTPAMLQTLRNRHSMAMPEIKHAVRDYLAVTKNIDRLTSAAIPSDSEMRHYIRDTEDKVRVRFVSLDAQNFVEKDAPVTNEEAQAQFEKYKEADAGTGDTGFGYRHPNRVQVEYILADYSKIQPQIQLSQEEVITYWRANKAKYKTTDYVDDPAAAITATSGPAASQPAKKKIDREKTFSEARPDVERELRSQKAAKQADQAMRKVASLLLKPWEEVKQDAKTGFKPIPAEVQTPGYMKSICETVSKEMGIPLDFNSTPLVSQEKLGTWPDLRGARMAGKGEDRPSLAEYAFNVPLFMEKKPKRESVLALQLFQTPDAPLTVEGMGIATLMKDPSTGKLVQMPTSGETERQLVFRVVDAQVAGVPASLDEVREDVERDVRLQKAFDSIKPVAEELTVAAERLGIDEALSLFEELRTKRGARDVIAPRGFARRESMAPKPQRDQQQSEKYMDALLAGKPTLVPPAIGNVGISAEFVDACFEMTQPGWKAPALTPPATTQMAQATTRPAATPEPVVRLLPSTKLRKWFVIQLVGTDPVDEQSYKLQLRQAAFNALDKERRTVLVSNWLKPENIELRCGFAPVRSAAAGTTDEGIQPIIPAAPLPPDTGY